MLKQDDHLSSHGKVHPMGPSIRPSIHYLLNCFLIFNRIVLTEKWYIRREWWGTKSVSRSSLLERWRATFLRMQLVYVRYLWYKWNCSSQLVHWWRSPAFNNTFMFIPKISILSLHWSSIFGLARDFRELRSANLVSQFYLRRRLIGKLFKDVRCQYLKLSQSKSRNKRGEKLETIKMI